MKKKEDTQISTPQGQNGILETKKSSFYPILLLVVSLILVGSITGYIIGSKRRVVIPTTPSFVTTPSLFQPNTLNTTNAFIREIPNFSALQATDLPYMEDTRGIYKYNDNYIITSVDRIIEFNPISKQIVRMNNPSVLGCVFSTAKVDTYLYVTCNDGDLVGNNVGKSKMAKIDLETGKIVKVYFTDDALKRINLWITALGSIVWGSSWDGIFVLDTATDQIQNISVADIGYPGCYPDKIYVKNNKIVELITDDPHCPGGGIAQYDEQNKKWIKGPYTNESVNETNQIPTVGGYTMPRYLAVSNLVDNTYILLSEMELFTLQKNEFPKPELVFPKPMLANGSVRVYVEPKARFVVAVGAYQGMEEPSTLASAVTIMVIDRTTKQISYLTDQSTLPSDISLSQLWTLFQENTAFVPSDNGVQITHENATIATIDFSPAGVVFTDK